MNINKRKNNGRLSGIYASPVLGIIGANICSNMFRGGFDIIFYLVIVELAVPFLAQTSIQYQNLIIFCGAYIGISVLYMASTMWSQTKSYVTTYIISSDLRIKIADKLRKLSLGYLKDNSPNKIASGILSQVQKSELILSRSVPEITAALILPLMLLVFLAALNIVLALMVLGTIIIAGIFLYMAGSVIARMGKKHMGSVNNLSFLVMEYFKNIKLFKSYNLTGHKFKAMDRAFLDLNKITFQTETLAGVPMQVFLLLLDFGYLGVFSFSVYLYTQEMLPLVHLLGCALIGYFLYEPVKALGALIVELRYAGIAVKRIEDLLQEKEPAYSEKQGLPVRNDIVFDKVGFGYKQGTVLEDFSASFPEGSITALVGQSGSGKSTVTNLVARFRDHSQGDIKLGGVSLDTINPELLLSKMSMVFQDVFLFHDTIAYNIKIGKRNASREEVIEAAKKARCHEFIMKLPRGYDTLVSEGGSSLSGGEKQRLSIARAILKDAPVVILDEATASLDPENEAEIQGAIHALVRNKTIIVIAHRLRSIEHADNILVLDKGKVAEQGTHEGLLQQRGIYYHLWSEQQKAKGWQLKNKVGKQILSF